MSYRLAQKTIETIGQALAEEKTTAIKEVLQIIQELAMKAFRISVSEMSDLIGRDPTITEKVISAANTLAFNPGGGPIVTISEAIHAIGFEKVRNLAMSILLLENADAQSNPIEQRELASQAVCSGILAQYLSESCKGTSDPDLVFVCASLRNYGKLVLSSIMIDDYRDAQTLSLESQNENHAFIEIFGLTPIELSRQLLQKTNLPKKILNTLQDSPPGTRQKAPQNARDETLMLAELSSALCKVAFDAEIDPDVFNDKLRNVLDVYRGALPFDLADINAAFIQLEISISVFDKAIGAASLSSSAMQRIRARINGESLPSRATARNRKPRNAFGANLSETQKEENFVHTQKEIGNKLSPGQTINLQEIYEMAISSIRETLELENCMIFIKEKFDEHSFSARYGQGPMYRKIRNRPLVSMTKKDVFSISITRREDILIQDMNAGKVRSVIPDWITQNSNTTSFVAFPVEDEKQVFAIIFGSVSHNQAIQLEKNERIRLKALRANLSELKRLVDHREVEIF